jgi:hypothetical protein
MAGVIENHSKFDVRMVGRFLQAEYLSHIDIHHSLVNIFSRNEAVINFLEASAQWGTDTSAQTAAYYQEQKW